MITDNKTLLDKTFPQNLDELREYGIIKELLIQPLKDVLSCFKKFISNFRKRHIKSNSHFFNYLVSTLF